jgi:beta-xylosidase
MDHKYKICAFYVVNQLKEIQKACNSTQRDVLVQDFLNQCIYNVGVDSIATWNEEKPPEPNLVVKRKRGRPKKNG